MDFGRFLFLSYVFLSLYAAGMMTALQLQHFALYSKVGREAFTDYIRSNNRAAFLPSILPAVLLTLVTVILAAHPSEFLAWRVVWISLLCNVVNLLSTGMWQARIHSQLERSGFDANLVAKLARTNWVRTVALWVEAGAAIYAVALVLNNH